MIRILVADDEKAITDHISTVLESCDAYEIQVFKAFSGTQALTVLNENKIDIAVLDVMMPGMTGLELAEKVLVMWPHTRIVFLTGYNNFDAMYKAMKNKNCFGYVLKNETDSIIREKILAAIEDIENELLLDASFETRAKMEHLINCLQDEDHVRSFLTMGDDYLRSSSASGLFEKDKSFRVMMVKTVAGSDSSGQQINYLSQVMQYMEYLVPSTINYYFCRVDSIHTLWLFQAQADYEDTLDLGSIIREISDNLVETYHKNLNIKVAVALYTAPVELSYIRYLYKGLIQYLQKRNLSCQTAPFVTYVSEKDIGANESGREIETNIILSDCIEKATEYVNNSETDKFDQLMLYLSSLSESRKMTSLGIISTYLSISSLLISVIDRNDYKHILSPLYSLGSLYNVSSFDNWKQAFDFLSTLNKKINQLLTDADSASGQNIVDKIKSYISQNYDKRIILSDLSSMFNYNESYISRIFKVREGIGVVEYIKKVRVRKAKELLTYSDDLISDISMKTGFETQQYFANVFRKETGMRPSEYRSYTRGNPSV